MADAAPQARHDQPDRDWYRMGAGRIILLNVLMVIYFVLVHALALATWDYVHLGLATGLLGALVVTPLWFMLQLLLSYVVKPLIVFKHVKSKRVRWFVFYGFELLIVVTGIVVALVLRQPERRFQKLVIQPIPASVADLDVSGCSGIQSAVWVFGFEIAPADFEVLLAQYPFEPAKAPPVDLARDRVPPLFVARLDSWTGGAVYIADDMALAPADSAPPPDDPSAERVRQQRIIWCNAERTAVVYYYRHALPRAW